MDTKKSRDEIIDRIEELLRKTKGASIDEVASARAKTQENQL